MSPESSNPPQDTRNIDRLAAEWISSGEADRQLDQRFTLLDEDGSEHEYELYDAVNGLEPKPFPDDGITSEERIKTPVVVLRRVVDGRALESSDEHDMDTMKATDFLLGIERFLKQEETNSAIETLVEDNEKEKIFRQMVTHFDRVSGLRQIQGDRIGLDQEVIRLAGSSDLAETTKGNSVLMAAVWAVSAGSIRDRRIMETANIEFLRQLQSAGKELVGDAEDDDQKTAIEDIMFKQIGVFSSARRTQPYEAMEGEAVIRTGSSIDQVANKSLPLNVRKMHAIAALYYGSSIDNQSGRDRIDNIENRDMLIDTLLTTEN